MSDSTTPVLGLTKPGIGASQDTWGNKLNNDSDIIDAFAGETNDFIRSLITRIEALEQGTEPIGTVKWWPGANPPAGGWLPCDGSQFLIATYPTIAAILGNAWGGDNITTFAIPDLRGRVLVGTDFGQGQLQGAYGSNVGNVGGAMFVTLSVLEMPTHRHGGGTDNQGDHSHGFVDWVPTTPGLWSGGNDLLQWNQVNRQTDGGGAHSHNVVTDWQGNGAAHANAQPGAIGIWIIRMING